MEEKLLVVLNRKVPEAVLLESFNRKPQSTGIDVERDFFGGAPASSENQVIVGALLSVAARSYLEQEAGVSKKLLDALMRALCEYIDRLQDKKSIMCEESDGSNESCDNCPLCRECWQGLLLSL